MGGRGLPCWCVWGGACVGGVCVRARVGKWLWEMRVSSTCVGAEGGRGRQQDEAMHAHQPRVELGDGHLLRCPRELPQEVLEEGLHRKSVPWS